MKKETLSNSKEASTFGMIDNQALKKAALVIRSLNNDLRQRILGIIDGEKKIIVTELYKKLNIEQSVASQQLGIMRREGVVKTERQGKFIYYTVNYERIQKINELNKQIIQ